MKIYMNFKESKKKTNPRLFFTSEDNQFDLILITKFTFNHLVSVRFLKMTVAIFFRYYNT